MNWADGKFILDDMYCKRSEYTTIELFPRLAIGRRSTESYLSPRIPPGQRWKDESQEEKTP